MRGFILTRQWRDTPDGILLDLWLATDAQPIQVLVPKQYSICFFRLSDQQAMDALLVNFPDVFYKPVDLKNIYNEAVAALYFPQQKLLRDLRQRCEQQGILLWEHDIKPIDRFLMERFITAAVEIDASRIQHKQGFGTLLSDQLKPCEYSPHLSVVSLDIETSFDATQLFSIAIYGHHLSKVFMVAEPGETATMAKDDLLELEYYESEQLCLLAFIDNLLQIDPDVIIGWHVVQFDCWVLQQICDRLNIKLSIGRGRQTIYWREDGRQAERRYLDIPGRVVLDGIELLRTAFYQFDNFTLQNVAQELLGDSKLLEHENRADAITQLFENDKLALARYNLHDCELVWRIFEKTKLIDFAIERSRLTGLPMDRMGGSVASFEYAYLPHLHRRGYVAPNLGEQNSDVISPGGYVMRSKPGLYQHVLVLDFKSLYPSIIRSFLIDPYGFWVAQHQQLSLANVVEGFNGAYFSRADAILPDIVRTLWQARERAKKENNKPLSQAIKIIMNAFYGVLGSPGCRFFDPRVCSSITLRGHDIIQRSRAWIEARGYQVIYGDTDSLFVWMGEQADGSQARAIGDLLASDLNQWWADILSNEFSLESALEIEFETHYHEFLMPTIRGSTEGSKKRYAGLIRYPDGHTDLVFKGMETVRADWTALAKRFQQELYRRVFQQEPYADYIQTTVADLLQGKLDKLLIYRKRLRQPLTQYTKTNPPHVKAARVQEAHSQQFFRKGDRIEYFITVNGPEPIDYRVSQIDYHHYLEKQLKPVANSILIFLNDDFDDLTDKQLPLFH